MGGIPLPQALGPEITQITSKIKKTGLNLESRLCSTEDICLLTFHPLAGLYFIFSRDLGEMADSYNSSHFGVLTCVTSEARPVKVSIPHWGSFLDISANIFGI
jgi:hypothetical protein